ncbi:MAG: efflux RND transporter periplasmic adaptor subunit [Byssovorax sp.]
MKVTQIIAGAALGLVLVGGGFVVLVHPAWIKPHAGEEEEDEKVDTEVPVHVGKIEKRTFFRYVEGYGNVAPEPAHDGIAAASARLASPATGVLAEARCAEGQKVDKGETLFQLDTRMAAAEVRKAIAARASARATLDRLAAAADFADRELTRTKKLSADGLASEKDLADAELKRTSAKRELAEAQAKVTEADRASQAASTQEALLRIQSPLAGTVVKVNVNPGEAVEASTVLAEVVDLDRLLVAATIPAADLRHLELGAEVQILVGRQSPAPGAEAKDDEKDEKKGAKDEKKEPAEKDEKKGAKDEPPVFAGKLVFIGYQVDTKSDTVAVRVSFPKGAALRPGEYVRVRIVADEHEDRLAVPRESVVRGEDGATVALVEGDKATQRAVKVGLSDGDFVEIEGEGLREGMTIVTRGAYGLPKETKIKVLGE